MLSNKEESLKELADSKVKILNYENKYKRLKDSSVMKSQELQSKNDEISRNLIECNKRLSLQSRFNKNLISLTFNHSQQEILYQDLIDEEILQAFPDLANCYSEIENIINENGRLYRKFQQYEEVVSSLNQKLSERENENKIMFNSLEENKSKLTKKLKEINKLNDKIEEKNKVLQENMNVIQNFQSNHLNDINTILNEKRELKHSLDKERQINIKIVKDLHNLQKSYADIELEYKLIAKEYNNLRYPKKDKKLEININQGNQNNANKKPKI